jgi:hypothetical protein
VITITEPGVYDIPEAEYFADPIPGGSLSASSAKKLLAEGGPARYRHQLDHPEPPSAEMELGTAAHKLVLGVGQEIAIIDAKDWMTKAAKADRDAARAAGKLPLLPPQHEQVKAMAAALGRNPTAAALLNGERGYPEMSAFWTDLAFGLWRRCRFDFMPDPKRPGIPVITDYKTCADASKSGFAKAVDNFGYHVQAACYCDGWRAIYGTDPAFVFVAQEKTPPYLVATYQLDAEALAIGRAAMARAMEIWRDCREAEADGAQHAWPGYSHEIETIALPRWSRSREDFYA